MDALESFRIDTALAAEAERAEKEEGTGQADFLNLLVAQLENQDPLNPQESGDLAVQLAQFAQVEELMQMREGIDQLVAAANASGAGGGTSALEPTSLVGKNVVVYGNQIEVSEDLGPVSMTFRTLETAAAGKVTVYDATGKEMFTDSFLTGSEEEGYAALPPGDHSYVFDPTAKNLPPGVYAIEFEAEDRAKKSFTVLPMVEGTVTGAILAGEPSVRIGNQIYAVADILEVRSGPLLAGGAGAGAGRTQTGGAQLIRSQNVPGGPSAP